MSWPLFDADADESVQTFARGGHKIHQVIGNNEHATTTFYLQIFDIAAPTVGTTVPRLSLPLEPGPFGFHFGDSGVSLLDTTTAGTSAMSYAVTTTPTGSTAPTANVTLNVIYS